MIELNKQQVAAWLRVSLAAGGPIAVLVMQKTGISVADWGLYTEIFLVFGPGLIVAVWSWLRNRETTQVKIVRDLPNVATVVVKDDANGKLGDLARSDAPEARDIVTETQNEVDAKQGTKTP